MTNPQNTDQLYVSASQLGEGSKFDSDKPAMALLPPRAMEEIAAVMGFGAKKYAAYNWTKGIAYTRLIGSLLRHVTAFMKREDLDPESGLPHLAHAGCCVMMLLEMTRIRPDMDDRCDVSDAG